MKIIKTNTISKQLTHAFYTKQFKFTQLDPGIDAIIIKDRGYVSAYFMNESKFSNLDKLIIDASVSKKIIEFTPFIFYKDPIFLLTTSLALFIACI